MHRRIGHFGVGVIASWVVILGLMLVACLPAVARPVVERVSFTPRSDGKGYVVRFHMTEPVQAYSAPAVAADGRLQIILFHTVLSASYTQDEPGGPVQHASVVPSDGHLVFSFEIDPGGTLSASAYRDRGSNDLLMGLEYEAGPVAARNIPTVPVRRTSLGVPENEEGPVNDARERWRLDTIVIDAGHGGKDTGATAHGVREKDITLAVATKVGRYLEEQLGVNVVYTRDTDHFVELKERGRIANKAGAKLFVSIHANAARNQAASGTETYFLGLHKTEAARTVMERENSVVQFESDPDQYAAYDEQTLILQTLAQSAYMHKSEDLAGLVEAQFTERVGRTSRGVKQAGFYVLWSASMPAILIELGFVTNRSEAAFLASERGQDYMASAIFRAIRDFKAEYEKDLHLVESR